MLVNASVCEKKFSKNEFTAPKLAEIKCQKFFLRISEIEK